MYLDNAASTEVIQPVKDKVVELLEIYGNPSSLHCEGQKAHKIIEDAANIIAAKFNCNTEEILFTSGATMSNNIAIQGYLRQYPDAVFITSAVEHNDIMLLYKWIKNDKFIISVNNDGYVNLNELEQILENNRDKNIICSIQMANSETGIVQDIKAISKLVHAYRGVLHTDATQYIPYYPLNISDLGIDMLSMSGQKIGCIKGVGLLYIKNGISITPVIFGEQGLIGGTENTLGIGALGEAIKNINYDYTETICRRDELITLLNGNLVGSHFNRLPNNINILFDGVSSERMVFQLDQNGICVSGGSACSSNSENPSHVIMAMGYTKEEARCCLRITIPRDIKSIEIIEIADIINKSYELLRG